MKSRRRLIIICGLLGAAPLAWAAWSSLPLGRGPVPSVASSFLRDVVEPITIADSMSFDDGGSQGLRFKDARGVLRDVCLEETSLRNRSEGIPEGPRQLILNTFAPHPDRGWRVPISGVEEKALLGLLERWTRQDPDAGELLRRYELLERGEIDSDSFWKDLSGEHRVKETAVSIMRQLRWRH